MAVKREMRRISGQRLPSSGSTVTRSKAMNNFLVARLWLWIAILDLMLFWGVYLRLQRMLGRVIICDRYIDDTRLDFQRNFPTVKFERMLLWRVLEWVTPTADASFLLWVPVDESIKRSQEKGDPFPDDEETLKWRLEAYMDASVFPLDRYKRLDCRRSVAEISETIFSIVSRQIDKGGHGDIC